MKLFVFINVTESCFCKQMEGSLADELYSEALQLSSAELGHGSTANLKQGELRGINSSLTLLFPY